MSSCVYRFRLHAQVFTSGLSATAKTAKMGRVPSLNLKAQASPNAIAI